MTTPNAAPLDLAQFAGFTPGPWTYDNIPGMDGRGFPAHLHRIAGKWNIPVVWLDCRHANDQPDARLIAAAPALLSECKRLRAENERLREAFEEAIFSLGFFGAYEAAAEARAALEPQS